MTQHSLLNLSVIEVKTIGWILPCIKELVDNKGNIYNEHSVIADNFNHKEQNAWNMRKFKLKEVFKSIKDFKNKVTLDTQINALKITNMSIQFMETLACVIEKFFREGIFPLQLKSAHVISVYIKMVPKLTYKIADQYLCYHIFLKYTKK